MHIYSFFFYNYKSLSSKGLKFSEKKRNLNFLAIWKSTHWFLNAYKASLNSMQWFKRGCAKRSCTYKLFNTKEYIYSILDKKSSKSSKEPNFQEKKGKQNFMVICTSTYCVLNGYKVSLHSMQQFKRLCAYEMFINNSKALSSKQPKFPGNINQNFLAISVFS